MDIHSRSICLIADHTADDPLFERVVRVNDHWIALVVYASGREECRVNGALYAVDAVEDLRADLGSSRAAEAFEQLTGLWPADWDRAYRRLYWRGWMDARRQWWLTYVPSRARLGALCRRYVRY